MQFHDLIINLRLHYLLWPNFVTATTLLLQCNEGREMMKPGNPHKIEHMFPSINYDVLISTSTYLHVYYQITMEISTSWNF